MSNVIRPDIVPGAPVWIADPRSPAQPAESRGVFVAAQYGSRGPGRNAITGFGMYQVDLALHRQFRVSDHLGLDARLEGSTRSITRTLGIPCGTWPARCRPSGIDAEPDDGQRQPQQRPGAGAADRRAAVGSVGAKADFLKSTGGRVEVGRGC